MEPLFLIPSYGYQRARNPRGIVRRNYYQRDPSPLDLTWRLFQLFDDGESSVRGYDSSVEKEQSRDKFAVSLQLGDAFSPDELSVKLVDRSLKVEGKHEEKGEDGDFSFRQFSRSFLLPDDVILDQLTSSFTADGVLNIEAPRLVKKELEPAERVIPIQQGERVSIERQASAPPTEEKKE